MSLLARLAAGRRGDPSPVSPAAVGPRFEHRETVWEPHRPASDLGVWMGHGVPLPLPPGERASAIAARIQGDADPRPIVVLDCETTGLTRGQVVPFVVGVARAEPGRGWCVHQWILRSPEGEVAMLRDLAHRMATLGSYRLLTYNGSSFDLPVLRSRGIRCGVSMPFLEGPHLDALIVARRLWRLGLPNCRLTTLERHWLGLRRVGDIPSHEIPSVFEAWLADANSESEARLGAVSDHNCADLLALGALLGPIERGLADPETPAEALGAGRHFLAVHRPAPAVVCLEAAMDAADASPEVVRAAGLLLAQQFRRRRDWVAAERVWRRLVRRFPGDPDVHEGLAKHLEHRRGSPQEALYVARTSRHPCPRRVARLERKARRVRRDGAPR